MRIFELLEDKENYYIASELLSGGELYDRIVKMKHFNE
jgi:calcium-dependent protein kinase